MRASAVIRSLSLSSAGLLRNWAGDYAEAASLQKEGKGLARDRGLLFPLLFGSFLHGLSLTGKGDYDDALSRIAAYLTAGADPELTKSLTETRERIERQLAGERCYDTYNAGIRAANEQKFAAARPLFEKVVAECAEVDATLVERARGTLDEISKFDRKKRR